jgi:hypothetical protein
LAKAPGIVYRTIATYLTRKAGYTKTTAHTGAVILIQRFDYALNLNIHLMCMDARMPRAQGCTGAAHMLVLYGVYVDSAGSSTRFRRVKAPTNSELNQLSHTIAHRLARYPERQGLLERDVEHSYLALDHSGEDPMDQLRGIPLLTASRWGLSKDAKYSPKAPTVGTLQTLSGIEAPCSDSAGQVDGFSLHAGVATRANQREKVMAGTAREAAQGHKLERLCHYIALHGFRVLRRLGIIKLIEELDTVAVMQQSDRLGENY